MTSGGAELDQPRSEPAGDDLRELGPGHAGSRGPSAAARRGHGSARVQQPLLAALFDSDGVLVDSRRVVERHWRRWAAEQQLDADEVMAVAHGRRTADVISRFAPYLNAERVAAGFEEVEGRDVLGLSAYEPARRLLAELRECCWGVVTSGTRALVLRRWAAVCLPVPALLVTGDEISCGKPYPDGYLLAARRLSVAPEACVAIEDAPAGVAAAKAAGMTTLAITTTHDAIALTHADLVMTSLRKAAQWLRANLAAESWR